MTRPLVSDREQRVSIAPWTARTLEEFSQGANSYDAVVAAVGYEPRCYAISAALPQTSGIRIAVEFDQNRTADFDRSLRRFKKLGFETNREWNEKFVPFLRVFLDQLDGDEPRVLFDISSMSRPRIAGIVQVLAEMPATSRIRADFLYAPAKFRPPAGLPAGVLTLQPVTSYFMGKLRRRSDVVGVVGLGYEPYKAAGALDSLEVRDVIACIPEGRDERFKRAVLRANKGLLTSHENRIRIDYRVDDPFDTYMMLDGQIDALLADGSVPTLVPLGPKIFALCSFLIAARRFPDISVWRASFEQNEPPVPHRPDGWVCGITVIRRPVRGQNSGSVAKSATA